ncbi:ImmA/IrrE family metallo-endopeptidase [Lactiplantibacillus plantarum]|uniref:ImmA/IrrE family metallo-endopeptidase n=1 Tax=Lactiplantibacillus plantarum TaxID=1590 RepID=UPI002B4BE7DE|nr:ImmA/IrrE family metallo-endopeptidase [Lactiplantibacillus plantarum]WRM30685.1 ImmA/IrrE family metallo-endopeptidase [Lactiplantibacillus plantarum]
MNKETKKNIDTLAGLIHEIIFRNGEMNLETALESAGITVQFFNDDEFDGFLKWDKRNNKPIISVNANHAEVRRNFSMAHELGHLVLNFRWIPYSSSNPAPDNEILNVTKYRGGSYTEKEKPEEVIANEFAAGFLIPDDDLRTIINEMTDGDYVRLVGTVAERFNVSTQAASIRIDNFLSLQEKA